MSAVSPLSHYMNAAGIGLSLVSIATGVSELLGMWSQQAKYKGGYVEAFKKAFTAPASDVGATKLKKTCEQITNTLSISTSSYLRCSPLYTCSDSHTRFVE